MILTRSGFYEKNENMDQNKRFSLMFQNNKMTTRKLKAGVTINDEHYLSSSSEEDDGMLDERNDSSFRVKSEIV